MQKFTQQMLNIQNRPKIKIPLLNLNKTKQIQINPKKFQFNRRKKFINPNNKMIDAYYQQEEFKILSEIRKINKLIRNKSDLMREKFNIQVLAQNKGCLQYSQHLVKKDLKLCQNGLTQIMWQKLIDSIKKQSINQYLIICFPEIVREDNNKKTTSRFPKNQKQESKQNPKIQSKIKEFPHIYKALKSQSHNQNKQLESQKPKSNKNKLEFLVENWESQLSKIVKNQKINNLFTYSNNSVQLCCYVSFSFVQNNIQIDRLYISHYFRTKTKQSFVKILLKFIFQYLTKNKSINLTWKIKQSFLKRVIAWGWKIKSFQKGQYSLIYQI